MFGMSSLLDSGGGVDVNAGAIGGEESGNTAGMSYPGATGMNYSQAEGQYGQPSYTNPNVDPASNATQAAAAQSDQSTQLSQQAMSAAQQAGNPAGAAGGLAGGIASLFDDKAKSVAKHQRKLARAEAQAGVDNAIRARDQYAEDSAIQRQQLQQSYSGRGLGESSIEQEGMQYFNDTATRKAAQLDQNVNLAVLGQQTTSSEISLSYRQPYMNIVGGILGML